MRGRGCHRRGRVYDTKFPVRVAILRADIISGDNMPPEATLWSLDYVPSSKHALVGMHREDTCMQDTRDNSMLDAFV